MVHMNKTQKHESTSYRQSNYANNNSNNHSNNTNSSYIQKYSKYCKKIGHLIAGCYKRNRRKQNNTANISSISKESTNLNEQVSQDDVASRRSFHGIGLNSKRRINSPFQRWQPGLRYELFTG